MARYRFTFEADADSREDFEEVLHAECQDAVGRLIRHGSVEEIQIRCASVLSGMQCARRAGHDGTHVECDGIIRWA